MPPVTDGAQVICLRGVGVAAGATLGTIAGALGGVLVAGVTTLGTDGGAVIMLSGCDVCWRKMELSCISWWR
jgi:hypothetical protein